jgi:hypothetical protein
MADRKISDLTALTAPAAGDYLPIVDISEVAAASKNKRITIEELFRGTPDGTAAAPAIAPESDPNTGIYSSGADQLSIATNGTERLRIDSAGQIEAVSLGTAAAPTFSFTGDPNTGIYSPGADQLAISTNGTGRLFIDASGNITNDQSFILYPAAGRGTLNINGPTDSILVMGGGGNLGLYIQGSSTGAAFGTAFGQSMVFNIGTERMRLDSSGRLGLGTSSPVSTLHCVGATVSEGDAAGQLVIRSSSAYNATPKSGIIFQILQDSSSNTAYVASIHAVKETTGDVDRRTSLVFGTRAITGTTAERMRITSAGNVGIGTTSPAVNLHVASAGDTAQYLTGGTNTSTARLYFINNTANSSIGCTTAGNELAFYTGTTERARIDSSGRVGIGTSSPSGKLNVAGFSSSDSNADIRITRSSSGTGIQTGPNLTLGDGTANNTIALQGTQGRFGVWNFGAGAWNERLSITPAGNVGIGTTSPLYPLHVEKNQEDLLALVHTGIVTYRFQVKSDASLAIVQNSTERARIDSSGNFGVGVTSPATASFGNVIRNKAPSGTGAAGYFTEGANSDTWFGIYSGTGTSDSAALLYPSTGSLRIATTTGVGVGGFSERLRIDSSGRLLVGTSSVSGLGVAKTVISESAVAAQRIIGTGNAQGNAQKITVVRHYPVVSLGTKLIIPFVSQGSLNANTICKVLGHTAQYNINSPLGFECTFAVGHLTSLANLSTLSSTGNISGIAINGMNIEITFVTGYTNATANGVFVCLEYMTSNTESSINVPNIAMN